MKRIRCTAEHRGNDRVVRWGEQILSRRDTKRPAVRLGMRLVVVAKLLMFAALESVAIAQLPMATQPLNSEVLVGARLTTGAVLRGGLLEPYRVGAPMIRLCVAFGRRDTARTPGCVRELLAADIHQLETVRLVRTLEGAVVGGVLGLGVGALVVTVIRGMDERDPHYTSIPYWLVVPTLTVGSLGALFGWESMFGAGTAGGIGT